MPLPLALGRINKAGLNKGTSLLAPHMPGLALLIHRGRKSGREFRTPINAFAVKGGFVVALTYGDRTDWVRNVLAAGECDLITRGHRVHCTSPRIYNDPTRSDMPRPVAWLLGHVVHIDTFLSLHTDD